jgi:hypothetical protein
MGKWDTSEKYFKNQHSTKNIFTVVPFAKYRSDTCSHHLIGSMVAVRQAEGLYLFLCWIFISPSLKYMFNKCGAGFTGSFLGTHLLKLGILYSAAHLVFLFFLVLFQ